MSVKALYAKAEGGKLYWYLEFHGAIPNSSNYRRSWYLYMDTDRDARTGYVSNRGGWDYYMYFSLRGDNSSATMRLYRYNSTTGWYQHIRSFEATLKPQLAYMEMWVEQQAIGYTPNGLLFYSNIYSYVTGTPEADGAYELGSNRRSIVVDGNAGDWGNSQPALVFPSVSVEPAELVPSALYVANDDDNLYFRVDVRGTPSMPMEAASLERYVYAYLDLDADETTGNVNDRGAEGYTYAAFSTGASKYGYTYYYRYVLASSSFEYTWSGQAAHDSAFEWSVPLSTLGLTTSGNIKLFVAAASWYLSDVIPRPVYYRSFPPVETAGEFSIVGLFGSEALFLAAVLGLMLLEAVVIILVMRRGRKEIPPPPP